VIVNCFTARVTNPIIVLTSITEELKLSTDVIAKKAVIDKWSNH